MQRYIENGAFHQAHVPEEAAFYKPWNAAYQDWAVKLGLYETPQPYLFSIWSEPMRRFQLAAEGFGPRQPPDHLRDRLKQAMHPCRSGTRPMATRTRPLAIRFMR
jgi:sulfite dehydrogenase (quinone) subunit SoeA